MQSPRRVRSILLLAEDICVNPSKGEEDEHSRVAVEESIVRNLAGCAVVPGYVIQAMVKIEALEQFFVRKKMPGIGPHEAGGTSDG